MAMFFLLFASLQIASAQDVIVKKNGSEIKVKVLEVGPSEVKYKMPDNPDGPLIIENTADLRLIRYANGSIDTIRSAASNSQELVQLAYKDPYFYRNGKLISYSGLARVIYQSGDYEAIRAFRHEKYARRFGKLLTGASIPVIVIGGVLTLSSVSRLVQRGGEEGTALLLAGVTLDAASATGFFYGSRLRKKGKQHMAKAIESFNQNGHIAPSEHRPDPGFNPMIEKRRGGGYAYNGGRIGIADIQNLILDSRNRDAVEEIEMSIKKTKRSKRMLTAGMPVAIASGITFFMSSVSLTQRSSRTANDFLRTMQITSGVLVALSGTDIVLGIITKKKANQHMRNAIDLYNNSFLSQVPQPLPNEK